MDIHSRRRLVSATIRQWLRRSNKALLGAGYVLVDADTMVIRADITEAYFRDDAIIASLNHTVIGDTDATAVVQDCRDTL